MYRISKPIHYRSGKGRTRGANRRGGRNGRWPRVVMGVLFAVLSLFIWFNIVKSVLITGQKLEILSQVENEVEFLRLRNIALVIEDRRVKTDDFIEVEARDKLHYARDGEVQFVISDNSLNDAVLGKATESVDNFADAKSNLEEWFAFFIDGV